MAGFLEFWEFWVFSKLNMMTFSQLFWESHCENLLKELSFHDFWCICKYHAFSPSKLIPLALDDGKAFCAIQKGQKLENKEVGHVLALSSATHQLCEQYDC